MSDLSLDFLKTVCNLYYTLFKQVCNVQYDSQSSTIFIEQREEVSIPVSRVIFQLCNSNTSLASMVENNKIQIRVVPVKFLQSINNSGWQAVQGCEG